MNADKFLEGNALIEKAITNVIEADTEENVLGVIRAFCERMKEEGHLILPIRGIEDEENKRWTFHFLEDSNKDKYIVAFTSSEEFKKGPKTEARSHFIDAILEKALELDAFAGIVINPWGDSFFMKKEFIKAIFDFNE